MTSWQESTRVGFQVCIWNPTSPLISSFEIPLKAFESFSPSTKPGHRTGVWLLCVFWVWLVRSGHECVERKKWQPGAPLFFHRNMSFTTNVWVSLLLHIQPYWQMDRQARARAHTLTDALTHNDDDDYSDSLECVTQCSSAMHSKPPSCVY